MKLILWSLIMMLAVTATASAQNAKPLRVYIGTYTQPGKSEGIYLFELDPATGKLTSKGLAGAVGSPSFIALHPNGKFLYAVSETGNFQGKKQGAVSAFSIAEDGKLTLLNQEGSGGSGPCHISIDPTGKAALVAHYGSAHITSFPIQPDGRLGELVSSFQHKGSSVNPGRQKEAHAHSTFVYPQQPTLAMACDLGMDKVMLYQLDPATAKLTKYDPESFDVPPGSGPRHLSFTPDGKRLFVISEMLCTINSFGIVKDGQQVKTVSHYGKTVSTLPEGTKVEKGYSTAEIVVHPSGKFLYGSNRGHDTIAIFALDDGKLTPVGHESTQGKSPRNFNITPDGKWLIAANEKSDTLVVFQVDPQTGKLTPTGDPVQCWAPVCVKFGQ
jgi:6-phosphogluconolactonase